jgi:hypothetical protein
VSSRNPGLERPGNFSLVRRLDLTALPWPEIQSRRKQSWEINFLIRTLCTLQTRVYNIHAY